MKAERESGKSRWIKGTALAFALGVGVGEAVEAQEKPRPQGP